MATLRNKFISLHAVHDENILLDNGDFLQASNSTDTGVINILRVNDQNQTEFLNLKTPVLGSDASNKQYVDTSVSPKITGPASSTDNALVRFDGTTGKLAQNSNATLSDVGGLILANFLRPGATTDTTAGNIRYSASELQGHFGNAWRVLGLNPTILSAQDSVTRTANTYTAIANTTATPAAGTYLVFFVCAATVDSNATGNVVLAKNSVPLDHTAMPIGAVISGLLASGTGSGSVVCFDIVALNGTDTISAHFRENGSGTLTIGNRLLLLIPISR